MTTSVVHQLPDRAPSATAATADAVATRREALTALDGAVRALLRRRLLDGRLSGLLPPVLDLTVYDDVYAAIPAAGGHWTAASRLPLMFGHQVSSYTVVLEFDERQRPARFRVCGAAEVVSEDASPESLDRTLVRARALGPQATWAPSFMPGISL